MFNIVEYYQLHKATIGLRFCTAKISYKGVAVSSKTEIWETAKLSKEEDAQQVHRSFYY
jgi:hypothetical protein